MTDEITMDKTYKTRDGRDVRVLALDMEAIDGVYSVVALVKSVKGAWEEPLTFTKYGAAWEGYKGHLDLIEVKPERVVWIVADGDSIISSYKHEGDARAWQWEVGGTIHKVILNEDNEVK